MIASLAHFLAQRSARERGLLLLLVALALPVAFAALVALPLIDRQAAAAQALAQAQATRAWYAARQSEIAALPRDDQANAASAAQAPIGLGGIEDRLIEAGLRGAVTLLANGPNNSVSLTLADVGFEALMAWVDAIERDAGYALAGLRVQPGGDIGLVDAELRLEPRA